jgi:SAM-dependent methyltransferase
MFSSFICNICGHTSKAENMHRELALCSGCGSNARFRAMMVGLSQGLFGRIVPMPEMKPNRGVRGFGCSDAMAYADRVANLFDYANTYLHVEPRVDVCDAVTLGPFIGCNFILCSDVLEHVLADPTAAIRNMYDCLKPGGCLVVSAPSYEMAATIEKYPTLRSYSVVPIAGRYVVIYETTAGAVGFDPDPVFHGGPGSVLEMRLFSHEALVRAVTAAGFSAVSMVGKEALAYGAVWPPLVDRNDITFPLNGRVIVAVK